MFYFKEKIDTSSVTLFVSNSVHQEFAVVPCVANPTSFEIPDIFNSSFFSPSYAPPSNLPLLAAFPLLSWYKTWAHSAPNL